MPNLTILLKVFLALINLPIFYRLIRRLTNYSISYQIKEIARKGKENTPPFKETRFIFQNQQDAPINQQVQILFELSDAEWYQSKEGLSSVSIVHGPTQKKLQQPNIEFLETPNPRSTCCRVTFPKGVRSFATWMIICRSYVEKPSIVSITANGDKVKLSPKENQRRSIDFGLVLRSFLFISILFLGTVFISNTDNNIFLSSSVIRQIKDFLNEASFGYFGLTLLLCLSIAYVFGFVAILICTPIKPNIIMGYLNENDPYSTTHAYK